MRFRTIQSGTIQTVSSHTVMIRAVEQILAVLTEYPYLPSVPNDREAIAKTDLARLFLLDSCSLKADLGPLAERCRARAPGSKFIAFLPPGESNDANEIRLFYWGIDGFVELHDAWQTDLPQAIHNVMAGNYWVRPEIFAAVVKHAQFVEQLVRDNSLTAREGQLLPLVMRHLSNKEIARQLDISERTVKYHVTHILAKLGIQDRRDLFPENFSEEGLSFRAATPRIARTTIASTLNEYPWSERLCSCSWF
jgi:DNA-binding NarL/FixJ family response regulator